jgi:hypothetical protein
MRKINDGLSNWQRFILCHPGWESRRRERCRETIRKTAREWVRRNRESRTAYAKKYYQRNKKHCCELAKKYRQEDPEKINARGKLAAAIKTGKIIRSDHCQRCGLICKPHGHHPNHRKPLEVIWLCTVCHGLEHRRMP